MYRTIDELEFSIFDTETTGLDPESGDRIVEIAAIKFKGQSVIDKFQSLVNPNRAISEAAFQVNRITEDMLKDAPRIEAVMPKFLNFIRGSCLCSYNAAFDLGFLNNELRIMGKNTLEGLEAIDILRMAKRLIPGLQRYALWFVADNFGIKTEQEHRALSDAKLTLEVFYKFRDILKMKGIDDFLNFFQLFSINRNLLNNINTHKIAQIQEALDLGVKLKIKYLSSSNVEVTEREVVPKQIKYEKGSGYLVGFCCLRNEERTFRIDGILHLEII